MLPTKLAFTAVLLTLAAAHAEDLFVGRVASKIHTVVYDLPSVSPQIVGMIRAGMKQQFPQAEAIDAAEASDAELRDKLKRSFLLVTMLDARSRLLPPVAQPLPLKLEGDTLRWDDFSAPAKDLRVEFVGRNPFGVGYALVLAVGSPALLQGGDNGQYSWVIKNSEGVLRKGTYDEEFTPMRRGYLKLDDARADAREFFANLERIHPDPFLRVTEAAYRGMKDQTFTDLSARAAKDGQVSIEDLAYLLRYAAAFIRDGHTELGWGASPRQEPIGDRRFPPFRVDFENGRFYISGAIDASLAGMDLVSVNGRPAAEFFSPALDRIAGELLLWRASRFVDNQEFFLWFTNLVGKTPGCCKLGLRDGNGGSAERTVEAVSLSQFARIRATAGRKFERHNGIHVRFFDSAKVAQFVYPAFNRGDDEARKIDDVFRQVREAKSQDLIVDIRSNPGGEPMMGNLIYSYISSKPVPLIEGGQIKISPEAMQSLLSQVPLVHEGELLKATSPDDIAREFSAMFAVMKEQPARPDPFNGRVWLLVDHRSFSAANLFSEAFRASKIGKILGYETAEPANIGGGIEINLTLQHSRIDYRVSASQNFVTRPTIGAEEHGVIPDVPFDRKLLAPFRDQPDPELAYTLDYIQKHR